MSSIFDVIGSWFSSTRIPAEVNSINQALGFLSPLSSEIAAFEAAWTSKNIQAELAAGLPIIETFMKVAGLVFPQVALVEQGVEILAVIIPPLVTVLMQLGDGLQPDGRGGYVPKHGWPLLDANGNFTGQYS